MKGYWVVAVQDVIKPDAWNQVLSAWKTYVKESNGICKPISFQKLLQLLNFRLQKKQFMLEQKTQAITMG